MIKKKKISIIFFHGLAGNKFHFDKKENYLKGYSKISYNLLGFGNNKGKISLKKPIINQQFIFLKKKIVKESSDLVFVFHSLSTVFLPLFLSDTYFKKKISKIILIEGDVSKNQLQWSERISNMTKRDFENYIHKFKSNHLKVMKMQLVKKHHNKLKLYSSGFKFFNTSVLRKFSKESVKIIKNNLVLKAIKKTKIKKLLIISKLNKALYSKELRKYFNKVCIIKDSGHFPMIDSPKSTYGSIEKFIK